MDTLARVNHILERFIPLITPTSLIVGIIFADFLGNYLFLPPLFFAFMTFCSSLNCGFSDLRQVARHPGPLLLILFLLHVWMPLAAFAAGHLFFPGNPYLVIGLIIEFMIPTGVIGLIWVTIYKGNIPLTLSLILLDTVITPFLMPPLLKLLAGASVEMDAWSMMKDLLVMIALPAVCAMAVHDISQGKASRFLSPRLAPASKLAIIPVIAINSTKLRPFFDNPKPAYFAAAAAVLFLAAGGYVSSYALARLTRQSRENTVSMFFNGSLRNISAGAVVAVQFFPGETVFPVMIGTLFQQVLAACAGLFLARRQPVSDELQS